MTTVRRPRYGRGSAVRTRGVAVRSRGGGGSCREDTMATKTKKTKKSEKAITRVVVPGVLVQVRANPRFFRKLSDYPWLVKEVEGDKPKLDQQSINDGWLEAKDLKFAGPVSAEAEKYKGSTWVCGVKKVQTNRAVMITTEAGCEYVPGPEFVRTD